MNAKFHYKLSSLEHVKCENFEESNSKIHNEIFVQGHAYYIRYEIFSSPFKDVNLLKKRPHGGISQSVALAN